jgi:hypothetical protein
MFDPIGHLSYEGRLKIHPPAMRADKNGRPGSPSLPFVNSVLGLLKVAASL